MNSPSLTRVFFGFVSAGALVFAIRQEIWWWRRRNSGHETGQVVDHIFHPDLEGTSYYPVIQMGHAEELIRFKSAYAQSEPFTLGTEVTIFRDPETRQPEVYSSARRVLPTLALLGFACLCGSVTLFGHD